MKEGEEADRNLEQGNLSGETNGEERGQVQDEHQGQESLSGESDVEEKVPDEEQDLQDLRRRERAPSKTLRLMTTPRTQESTPTQTGTRAQDRNCQSQRSTRY